MPTFQHNISQQSCMQAFLNKKKPGSFLLRSELRASHSLQMPTFQHNILQQSCMQVFLNKKKPGNFLLSHFSAVSSALESLTSVFGMGTGITSPLWPPGIINNIKEVYCVSFLIHSTCLQQTDKKRFIISSM